MPQLDIILFPIHFRYCLVVFGSLYFLVSFLILPLLVQLFYYRNLFYNSVLIKQLNSIILFNLSFHYVLFWSKLSSVTRNSINLNLQLVNYILKSSYFNSVSYYFVNLYCLYSKIEKKNK